jgi:hypothetical protein
MIYLPHVVLKHPELSDGVFVHATYWRQALLRDTKPKDLPICLLMRLVFFPMQTFLSLLVCRNKASFHHRPNINISPATDPPVVVETPFQGVFVAVMTSQKKSIDNQRKFSNFL